jgi:hypothetical protein
MCIQQNTTHSRNEIKLTNDIKVAAKKKFILELETLSNAGVSLSLTI